MNQKLRKNRQRELIPRSDRPLRIIRLQHHTLTIDESSVPHTILIDRATHAPSGAITAEFGEEPYVHNEKTTHLTPGAKEANESRPLEANVRIDEETETPTTGRNNPHQPGELNNPGVNDEDERPGLEDTELLKNTVNEDDDDTRK